MGADIHAYIEDIHTFRENQRSAWLWAEPHVMRDYALFGMLALEAIIGAMKAINKQRGHEARLVFWFDN